MPVFFIIIVFFLASTAHSATTNVEKEIQQSRIPKENVGIWIKGPDKFVNINSDKMMVPASLSKIPTAAAALDILGLDHRFKTNVYHTGKIKNGVLSGDLYLQGNGDPSLVSENYWKIVNELKRSDIKSIQGQLYVDDTHFDKIRFSVSRRDTRVDRAYDAPIGAMSFNWNSINVHVRPAAKKGQPARVYLDPESDYVILKNNCKTGSRTQINVSRNEKGTKDQIHVSGTIAVNSAEKTIYKSISRPDLWSGYNFKTFLNEQGITYTGDVKVKKTPGSAKLLVEHESKPLSYIVADMSKFSNNYVAEMLTKSLSPNKPANLTTGIQRIEAWLREQGMGSKHFIFETPSGFSSQNKFKAAELGELLEKIKDKFSLAPEFMTSLPVAGIDGTLEKRLRGMKGRVRAKTGFLAGAVGLAGYVEKNNKVYTFVMMYNGPRNLEQRARPLFDDILESL